MSSRDLIFSEGVSNKFWTIQVTGKSFSVTFGRIGTAGQTKTKTFASAALCDQAAARLVAEKLAKGYRDRKAASGTDKGKSLKLKAGAKGADNACAPAVAKAVARVVAAIERLAKADSDEGLYAAKPNKPASAKALAAYEKRLGRMLPPSYRAFLAKHDGYRGLNIHGDLVSIADASPGGACHRQVMELKSWGHDDGEVDWDAIIPIATVEGQHDFVYLDPARVGPAGELGIVAWYHDDDPTEYVDLLAYLGRLAERGDDLARDLPRIRQEQAIADKRRDEQTKQAAAAAVALEGAARLSSLPIKKVQQGPLNGNELPHLHKHDLRAVAFSHDGATIVVGEDYGPVRWWDVRSGKLLETQPRPTSAFQVEAVAAGWAIVAGETITIRGAEQSAPIAELSCDEATHMLQSAAGDRVFGVSGGALTAWATASWRSTGKRKIKRELRDLAFTAGGSLIAGLESGGTEIGLWKADTLETAGVLSVGEKLYCLASGGSGDLLAAAGGDVIRVWRGSDRSSTSWNAGEGAWVQCMTISPDGGLLVSSACGDVRAWRLTDGHELARWDGSGDNVRLRFSPDGTVLAEVGEELRLWTVPPSWRPLR